MKLKQVSLAVAASFLLVTPSSFAQGNPESEVKISVQDKVDTLKPYIEVYDKEGKLVKKYSDAEIQLLIEKAKQSNKVLEAAEAPADSPYVHITDENNLLTDSSVEGAVEEQQAALSDFGIMSTTYNYSGATISSSLYVRSGYYFPNPTTITFNTSTKFEGLNIRLWKSGSTIPSGSVKIGGFLGGVAVPLSNLYSYDGSYKIQLINANTNGATIKLNAGTFYYN
ncbi:hypothetical protein ACFRCQ_14625 [Cytobacillus firmus]|uniref:hypothetical protein n=1 Tax=Cytobacillus firmus TaxID=1399 RepID=UPI00369329C5